MDKQTLVIKLGGALIENDEALTALFATLKTFLDEQHRPLVLVHGGGCLVDDLLKGLGLTSTKKNGLRVTPFEQIPFIAGALAGTANKMMGQGHRHRHPGGGALSGGRRSVPGDPARPGTRRRG